MDEAYAYDIPVLKRRPIADFAARSAQYRKSAPSRANLQTRLIRKKCHRATMWWRCPPPRPPARS